MVNGNFTDNAKACMARLEKNFGKDSIVAAMQCSKNDLVVVIRENTICYATSFMMSLLHSDDEFKTDKQDCLRGDWQFGREVCNRIGLISFTTYTNNDYAWLNLVEIDKNFYGQGYGSIMMSYLKSLLQNNSIINLGKKCNKITGRFEPHGAISSENVKKFYLRHGCNSDKINACGFIDIKADENKTANENVK